MNLITNHRQNHKEEIWLVDRWPSLELEDCVLLLVLLFVPHVTPAKPFHLLCASTFLFTTRRECKPSVPQNLSLYASKAAAGYSDPSLRT